MLLITDAVNCLTADKMRWISERKKWVEYLLITNTVTKGIVNNYFCKIVDYESYTSIDYK
jgi:hypothetical protein